MDIDVDSLLCLLVVACATKLDGQVRLVTTGAVRGGGVDIASKHCGQLREAV